MLFFAVMFIFVHLIIGKVLFKCHLENIFYKKTLMLK